MLTCLVLLSAFLWWARQALPGLPSVWWGLFVFFFLRAAQSVPRAVLQLGLMQSDCDSNTEAAAVEAGKQPSPA